MKKLRKKKLRKFSGIVAAAALIAATGCVTATTIGGTADAHGLFTGYPAAENVTGGSTEIASYSVVLGLFDVGHDNYAAKVKEAQAKGKKITTKTMWYVFVIQTTAYAK